MAVMAPQLSEGIAIEQKTSPVPSSDKMALDIDINGPALPDTPNQLSESSNLEDLASSTLVNGVTNNDAFFANGTIDTPPADLLVDHLPTEESSALTEQADSLEIPSTIASFDNTENPTDSFGDELYGGAQPDDFLPDLPTTSIVESAISHEIESAVEDTAPTSTVLPIVEAQESDLRHTSPPLELPAGSHLPNPDFNPDSASLKDELTSADQTNTDLDTGMSEPARDLRLESEEASVPDSSVPTSGVAEQQAIQFPKGDAASQDVNMTEAQNPSQKISREREDDNEVEPSAKRTKTGDGLSSSADIGASLDHAKSHNDEPSSDSTGNIELTPEIIKDISKIMKNEARTVAGKGFAKPVIEFWPQIAEGYLARIKNPIDFGTMDLKLKNHKYTYLSDYFADLKLLLDNCITFNGETHDVTLKAVECRQKLTDKINAHLMKRAAKPIMKQPKKPAPKRATPLPEPAYKEARRGSRGVVAATVPLDPETSMPKIRRDSTNDEAGRPKREIKQPRGKDLDYHHNSRPKSKKYAAELRFCQEVINELKKSKNMRTVDPFMFPVDSIALKIPDYHTVVKNPMDISKLQNKLNHGEYSKAAEFEKDFRLIAANAKLYNGPAHPVSVMGKSLDDLFNAQWAKKDQYLANQASHAAAPAYEAAEDSDGAEESEDDYVEPTPSMQESVFTTRLVEEQSKLIQLMTNKQANKQILDYQQGVVRDLQQRVEDEKAAQVKKAPKKSKPSKPSKKPAAAPKRASIGGGGGAKKAKAGGRADRRHMGALEKDVISQGVGLIGDDGMLLVAEWIKIDAPEQYTDNGEIEMDIEALTTPTLWKIFDLVVNIPEGLEIYNNAQENLRSGNKTESTEFARPATKKKNKPMKWDEQERKIAALKNSVNNFERTGSMSQEPVINSVEEDQDESSGDEESEDSEED